MFKVKMFTSFVIFVTSFSRLLVFNKFVGDILSDDGGLYMTKYDGNLVRILGRIGARTQYE